jgi:alpha-aminoadipic semialdehyde synthase
VSSVKNEADRLASKYPQTTPVTLNVLENNADLKKLIKSHQCVISLLPYIHHPLIAQMCIKYKVNMVTASYLSKQMEALHDQAKQAGVTILNEFGLDPGIDHMLSMQAFDEIKEAGGVIDSFHSYCGGLPAPEAASNALRYKFSWSPRGVLFNTISTARYLNKGKIVDVPGNGALLELATTKAPFLPGFNLEMFPNRDSTSYVDLYNIPTCNTIVRGTLRYSGFAHNILSLLKMGLVTTNDHPSLHPKGPEITWRQFMCDLMSINRDTYSETVKARVYERLDRDDEQMATIEELGLLSDDPLPKLGNPIDSLAFYMSKRLGFGPHERDIVIMHNEIGYKWPNGNHEIKTIDFIEYGKTGGFSAMAKTVGLPCAIATKMILESKCFVMSLVVDLQF